MKATGEPGLHACTYFYPDTVTWAFGTHAAAVEVDVETAAVRLLAYAVVHDPGRAINPMIVEAQLQGGAVQAIGAGLMEAVVYDAAGQLLSGSLMDYAIPRADDLPSIPVALTEHRSAINPLGVKGVGESGAIPGAAAIANAVEDAVAHLGRHDPRGAGHAGVSALSARPGARRPLIALRASSEGLPALDRCVTL